VPARPKVPETTIVDIAAAAGVSVTTVSRIINDKPDVAEDTRERVMRLMEETGFVPQSAWRQIRSGRSGLIALHVPADFNPPSYRVIMAAALGVEDAGYSINIITRSLSDSELLALFRSRKIDGIILLEVLVDDRRAALLREHGYPFVMVGRRADNTEMSLVEIDIDHGIGVAVDHLLELGHRRIGFLTINPVAQDKVYGFVTWSLQAYERVCARRGLPVLSRTDAPAIDAMTIAAQGLLTEHPEITAVIAPQEQSAIGIVRAAKALGRRIPEDLSVIAMLSRSMAELATPALTTLDFPADEMGRTAARTLVDQLGRRKTAAEQVYLKPALIARGSTAAPSLQTPSR
jgi:DNA-binding LacI/PurR family transcriptional regulator